jgi:hypothetical protein
MAYLDLRAILAVSRLHPSGGPKVVGQGGKAIALARRVGLAGARAASRLAHAACFSIHQLEPLLTSAAAGMSNARRALA